MSLILKPWYILKLFAVFLYDLVVSSLQVAAAVLRPQDRIRPRLLTIALDTRTDVQTMLVGNFISLTPGTLTVDVGTDRRTLLVHDMFAGDSSQETRGAVLGGLQKRVLEATG
ncbi:Na+/H+ antiporter subunit E [soil metagenome]